MIDMIKRFPGIGCAYIGQNGDPGYEYYGFSDKESQREVDERTIFPACSISKFITAICTMKLSEQGIIDIDEAADKYLSSWKLHGRNGEESDASVRHLLQHTAGIFDGEEGFCGHRMTDRAISITEILEGSTAYNNRPAVAGQAPGTAFEYSDAGFCILQ
ncbi:MAG: beta-lactamase family protein [Lachnospiraceae bacterium]|nr:serine hydrolase domain-containing protein [uncultured Acetatifactor sp.]MCI9574878.1 beta-lactamase family protein [Lachnospiraceae bacterium]